MSTNKQFELDKHSSSNKIEFIDVGYKLLNQNDDDQKEIIRQDLDKKYKNELVFNTNTLPETTKKKVSDCQSNIDFIKNDIYYNYENETESKDLNNKYGITVNKNVYTDPLNNKEYEDHTYLQVVFSILQSSMPATCSLLFVFITETINIVIIGRLNNPMLIASIGLGTLYVNATGYIPGMGLLGGIETLCSQAYGKKKYSMVGNFASVGRLTVILFFVLFSIPMNFLSYILLNLIGIESEICLQASHFCHAMSISVFFALQFNTSLRYLQSMNIYLPGSLITLVTAILHPLWSMLLVYTFGLGVVGAGLSIGITQFINFVTITIYIHLKNPCPESYFYIGKLTFKFNFIKDYLYKAVPAGLMFAADWIGFEILTFLSSFLGPVSLAANVCMFNFISIIFIFHLGLSLTTTTLVGNSVGAGNKTNIYRYSVTALLIGVIMMIISTSLVMIFRSSIPHLYTDEKSVGELFYNLLGIYMIFSIPDSIQMILHGIIKGLGRQKWASVCCLIVLYPINTSLGYTLAFYFKLGIMGLWYSQMTSIFLLIISYLAVYMKCDIDEIIEEVKTVLDSRRNSIELSEKLLTSISKIN